MCVGCLWAISVEGGIKRELDRGKELSSLLLCFQVKRSFFKGLEGDIEEDLTPVSQYKYFVFYYCEEDAK